MRRTARWGLLIVPLAAAFPLAAAAPKATPPAARPASQPAPP